MRPDHLSLADLEAGDPYAPRSDGERRFLCPVCGDGKSATSDHRSLSLNTHEGTFYCYRCKTSGKLRDFWRDRPAQGRRERERTQLHRLCSLPPAPTIPAPTPEKAERLRGELQKCEPLEGTAGARYLHGRGVPVEVSRAAGARFSRSWLGRPAVLFAIRDRDGALVAAQGRYIDGRTDPKALTLGEKKRGVFLAPWRSASGRTFGPLDPEAPAVIITEAPLDALSFAAVGFPALALCGTSGPLWLPKAAAFRRVLLAFDADDAGDQAAAELAPVLGSFGARAERLRPEGAKDWNELLQAMGPEALADFLTPTVYAGELFDPTTADQEARPE